MNGKKQFTVDYWKDGQWFVGRLRDVPGIFSQGKTLGELLDNLVDAYRMLKREKGVRPPVRQYKTIEVGIPV